LKVISRLFLCPIRRIAKRDDVWSNNMSCRMR